MGTQLPPVLKLSEEYGCSYVTAHRAVRELAEAGLVVPYSGRRGTMVVRRPSSAPSATMTLACLFRDLRPRGKTDDFGLDMIDGVRDAVSARDYRFVYHCLDEADCHERMLHLLRERWVSGVLLDELTELSLIKKFLAEGTKPVAVFNRVEALPNLISACPDYNRVGRETAAFLAAKGYERIGFVPAIEDRPSQDEAHAARYYRELAMRRGFVAGTRGAGVESADVVFLPLDHGQYSEPEEYGLPRRRPKDWRPLGIFAVSDTRALRLMRAIAKTDLVLGRDIGVVGCFNLAIDSSAVRPPSTWAIDPHGIGAAAANELLNKIEDPSLPAATIKIPMEFLDRGTA